MTRLENGAARLPRQRQRSGSPRSAELDALFTFSERGDRERLLVVEGPTGIGKAKLLTEFKTQVRLSGGVVLEGRCEPAKPFGAFADVIDRALRFLEELEVTLSSEIQDGLACGQGCHGLWHQHIAGDAMDSSVSLLPSSPESRYRLFDSIEAVLRTVASLRSPLVLLHDIERADIGTLELIQHLLDGGSEIEPTVVGNELIFIASLRTDAHDEVDEGVRITLNGFEAQADLQELLRHPRCEVLQLQALDEAGVRAFLMADDTVRRVLARTGGNPALIELLLEADPLSPSERMNRRLHSLSLEAQRLILALAVWRRPADISVLRALTGLENIAHSCTDEMRALEWLHTRNVGGEISFNFVREAEREAIYSTMFEEVRKEFHTRAVELCAHRREPDEAVWHALATNERNQAIDLALAAARALATKHAHSDAAALLEALVTTEEVDAPDLPPAIIDALIELHRISGDFRRAVFHAERSVKSNPQSASHRLRLGHLLTLAGDHAVSEQRLTEALSLARKQNDDRCSTESESHLAELAYQVGDYDGASRWAESAVQRATKVGLQTAEVRARNTLGKIALAQRSMERAEELFSLNRVAATATGSGHLVAQAITNLGTCKLMLGSTDEAADFYREAEVVARKSGDSRDFAIVMENLAVIAHRQRDYQSALVHYQNAIRAMLRLGNVALMVRAVCNLGELYATLGDYERARSLCALALRKGADSIPKPSLSELQMLIGRLELNASNASAARNAYHTAYEIFESLHDGRIFESSLELASLELHDGRVAEARKWIARAGTADTVNRRTHLALLEAQIAQAEGTLSSAQVESAIEQARDASEEQLIPALLLATEFALADDELDEAMSHLLELTELNASLFERVPEETRSQWEQKRERQRFLLLAQKVEAAVVARQDRQNERNQQRTTLVPPPVRNGALRTNQRPHRTIVGSSPAIQAVLSLLDKVAASDATVLVRGESGTGKELLAEALHVQSPRASKPLIKVNCAALVETLLLSELFGHEKGSFTGAAARKKGRFELADGGTLFLDEIGDISAKTQVALLRVLQEREFERVGGTVPIRVDVRIVCATHRDLERMVREGTFREDLYYRLRGITLEMPALRKRLSDLPELCDSILNRVAGERGETPKVLTAAALHALSQHRWPGNIRELENVLRSASLFAETELLDAREFQAFLPEENASATDEGRASFLPPGLSGGSVEDMAYEQVKAGKTSLFEMKKDIERQCIVRALAETRGNITKAASVLGMKRPRLSQLVKEYNLLELTTGSSPPLGK